MKDTVREDGRPRNGTRFFGMAFIALLAQFASCELHESLHFIVGRLAGLPCHFLSLTSVGVTPAVAATASPSALALMNGVAPLATMLLGILALVSVPALRPKVPVAVTDFIAWCAIFAVPYIGLQTMFAAAPIRLRGDGADSAAVLGGYFGFSLVPRTAISVAGVVIFMASGFCLGRAVSWSASTRVTLGQHLRALAAWRLATASLLGLLLVSMTVRGAIQLAHGNGYGMLWLVRDIYVWAAMMTLLVRWRAPGARDVRDRWIFPGLLACAGLLAIGLLTHVDDFIFIGKIYVFPLIATAWIQTSADEPEFRPQA
jgi:hypothetical protein